MDKAGDGHCVTGLSQIVISCISAIGLSERSMSFEGFGVSEVLASQKEDEEMEGY